MTHLDVSAEKLGLEGLAPRLTRFGTVTGSLGLAAAAGLSLATAITRTPAACSIPE